MLAISAGKDVSDANSRLVFFEAALTQYGDRLPDVTAVSNRKQDVEADLNPGSVRAVTCRDLENPLCDQANPNPVIDLAGRKGHGSVERLRATARSAQQILQESSLTMLAELNSGRARKEWDSWRLNPATGGRFRGQVSLGDAIDVPL
jgi:hypothetical protein